MYKNVPNVNMLTILGLTLLTPVELTGNLSLFAMNSGPGTFPVVLLWKIIGVLRRETTNQKLHTPAGNPTWTTLRQQTVGESGKSRRLGC